MPRASARGERRAVDLLAGRLGQIAGEGVAVVGVEGGGSPVQLLLLELLEPGGELAHRLLARVVQGTEADGVLDRGEQLRDLAARFSRISTSRSYAIVRRASVPLMYPMIPTTMLESTLTESSMMSRIE